MVLFCPVTSCFATQMLTVHCRKSNKQSRATLLGHTHILNESSTVLQSLENTSRQGLDKLQEMTTQLTQVQMMLGASKPAPVSGSRPSSPMLIQAQGCTQSLSETADTNFVTSKQIEDLRSELLEMVSRLLPSKQAQSSDNIAGRAEDTDAEAHIADGNYEVDLHKAFDHLVQYAKDVGVVESSEETEKIIDALEVILGISTGPDEHGGLGSITKKRKRENCISSCDSADKRRPRKLDVRKIKGALYNAEVIGLNQHRGYADSFCTRSTTNPSLEERSRMDRSFRSVNDTWTAEYASAGYQVMLQTRKRRQKGHPSLVPEDNESEASKRKRRASFAFRLSLLPTDQRQKYAISAYGYSDFQDWRTVTFCPIITFNAIIPDDSDIFEAIKLGDFDWMLELFESRNASPHDCDPDGRSLLYVSPDESASGRDKEICLSQKAFLTR